MQIIDKEDRIVLFIEEENDLDTALEKINKNDFNHDSVELYFGKYSVIFLDEKLNIVIYFFENKNKDPDKYSRLNLKESIFKNCEWTRWSNLYSFSDINGITTNKKNFKNVLIDLFRISRLECFE
jgi:hypothetical protein